MPKHHYVPRFYLNAFVDPASRDGREPYLWVADLKEMTVKRRAPKNVAAIAGFYDWEDVEGDAPSIEALYASIEGKSAQAIRKLCRQDFDLTSDDRHELSKFLGFQLTRVPGFRRASLEGPRKKAHEYLMQLVSDDERLQLHVAAYNEAEGKSLSAEGLREAVEREEYRLNIHPDVLRKMSIKSGIEFTMLVLSMTWSFVIAGQGAAFFTSDQPVAMLTPKAKPIHIDFETGHNPDLELWFPVSPSCALLLHQRQPPSNIVSIDRQQATDVLEGVLPTVERFVFSSQKDLAEWALEQGAC